MFFLQFSTQNNPYNLRQTSHPTVQVKRLQIKLIVVNLCKEHIVIIVICVRKGKLLYVSKQRYDLLKPTSDDLVPKVTSGKESFYNNVKTTIDTETRHETT